MIFRSGIPGLAAVSLSLALTDPLSAADPVLYTAVLSNKRYVVGAENASTGLWASRDFGRTWKSLSWANVRAFDLAVCPGPTADRIFLAAGNGVLSTEDGGVRWKILTGWEITEVQDIAVHPKSGSLVVIGTAYGVFLSENGGGTWVERSEGLDARFCSALEIDRDNEDRIWVGTENGVYLTLDRGKMWKTTGLSGTAVRVVTRHPEDSDFLFAGTEDHGVHWSVDGGRTWKGCRGPMNRATVYDILFDLGNSRVVYAATHGDGVFASSDLGKTWKPLSGMEGKVVHSLGMTDGKEAFLFAGTVGDGIYRRSLAGGRAPWTAAGLPGAQVWAMEVRR